MRWENVGNAIIVISVLVALGTFWLTASRMPRSEETRLLQAVRIRNEMLPNAVEAGRLLDREILRLASDMTSRRERRANAYRFYYVTGGIYCFYALFVAGFVLVNQGVVMDGLFEGSLDSFWLWLVILVGIASLVIGPFFGKRAAGDAQGSNHRATMRQVRATMRQM